MPKKNVDIKIKNTGAAEPGPSDNLEAMDDIFINLEKQFGVKNIKIDYAKSYVKLKKNLLPLYGKTASSFYFTPLVKGKCEFFIAYSIEVTRAKNRSKARKKTKTKKGRNSFVGITSLVVNLPHILDGGSTRGQLDIQ